MVVPDTLVVVDRSLTPSPLGNELPSGPPVVSFFRGQQMVFVFDRAS